MEGRFRAFVERYVSLGEFLDPFLRVSYDGSILIMTYPHGSMCWQKDGKGSMVLNWECSSTLSDRLIA